MNKIKFTSFVFVFVLCFTACRSKEKITRGAKAKSPSHFISLVKNAQPKFSALNATSIQLTLETEDSKKKVAGSLKMRNDSVIIISISPFMGIELYSLELYPEKWIIYNKINRIYAIESYEYFLYNFGINVDFQSLQALLSARLMYPKKEEKSIEVGPLILSEDKKSGIRLKKDEITQSVFINNNYNIEHVHLTNKEENVELRVSYSEYEQKKGEKIPQKILFETFKDEKPYASLNINIQKVNFRTDIKIGTSKPERYSQVPLTQIIKQ